MKKLLIALIALITFTVVVNNSLLGVFLDLVPFEYDYTTKNGEFTDFEMPTKGRLLPSVESRFENFKSKHSELSDKTLYRTFEMHPLKFWLWYEYLTHKRYKYPLLQR